MYIYTFLLTPSRNKSEIIFTNYKEVFAEAVYNINGGLAFKRDGKKLTISNNDILEKEFKLTLSSKLPLDNPARSLSSFTRYLTTTYPDIFKPFLYNKTLFSMSLITQESTDELSNDFEPTNEEILKSIIDLLYSHTEKNEVKIARTKIIEILKSLNL